MSVTPDEFLTYAVCAATPTANEFDLRNSASRAYYAAFHCCLAERSRCPSLSDSEIRGSHDKLYARFNLIPASEPKSGDLKAMAYLAKMMKSVRHDADYDIGSSFSADDAKQQLRDARKVVSHWKSL